MFSFWECIIAIYLIVFGIFYFFILFSKRLEKEDKSVIIITMIFASPLMGVIWYFIMRDQEYLYD